MPMQLLFKCLLPLLSMNPTLHSIQPFIIVKPRCNDKNATTITH